MFRDAINPVWSKAYMKTILDTFVARPSGPLVAIVAVDLWTAGPTVVTPDNIKADFTVATFNGYAQGALVPDPASTTVVTTTNGLAVAYLGASQFIGGSGVTPPGQTILGYYLTDSANHYMIAEKFASPVQIAGPGDFLELSLLLPLWMWGVGVQ